MWGSTPVFGKMRKGLSSLEKIVMAMCPDVFTRIPLEFQWAREDTYLRWELLG